MKTCKKKHVCKCVNVYPLPFSDVLIVTMDTSVLVQADRLESATTKDTATVEITGI